MTIRDTKLPCSKGRHFSPSPPGADTAWRHGVPGTYELQLIPEGHVNEPWDSETLIAELYAGAP